MTKNSNENKNFDMKNENSSEFLEQATFAYNL